MLERECKRNIEVMWLLEELTPDHNTIANFRKDNPKAIKAVFRRMVIMCKALDLIGGKVIATDGTKFRAQNSKKNNYNQKKIDDHLRYIGLMFIAYLFTRMKNILGVTRLKEAMGAFACRLCDLFWLLRTQMPLWRLIWFNSISKNKSYRLFINII